jgi:penicillin-binding protein 1A
MSFEKKVRGIRERGLGNGASPAKPEKPRPRRGLGWRIAKWTLLATFLGAVLGAGALASLFYVYGKDLPKVDTLAQYDPPTVTRIYGRAGELIAEYAEDDGYRTVVPLSRIPKHVVDAVLAAEDADFRNHEGLDYFGMLRAFFVNLFSGKFKQGGSTITQQVVKTFLLSSEKSIPRKIKEVILARRLEEKLSKDDILTLYLNQIYFGHRRFGIEEASRAIFGKGVERLTLGEAAVLAGLIKSPARFSPRLHPQRARVRQREVLQNLLKASEAGKLSRRYSLAEVQAAMAAPIVLGRQDEPHLGAAPYYADWVKQEVQKRIGERAFFRKNLRIETACDVRLQKAAERALQEGLRRLDRRGGWRGPEKRVSPSEIPALVEALARDVREIVLGAALRGIVLSAGDRSAQVALGPAVATLPFREVRWARRPGGRRPRRVSDVVAPGDLIRVRVVRLGAATGKRAGEVVVALDQVPEPQGALVAIDPASREVLALVGGYDFARSPFNRAVKARRQPGSAFKPIVYSAALRTRRYTPATIVLDSPAVYGRIFDRHAYRPHNYDRAYRGEVRLASALAQSLNLVAVKVADDIGIEAVRQEAAALGIESPISANLAVALGADSVTPLELANAYAVFASGGRLAPPRFIRRILSDTGPVAWEPDAPAREAMTPEQAYVMTRLLRAPVEDPAGTARGAGRLGYLVAGKTGTSNGHRDVWFVGYTPELLAAVWVGNDDRKPLGGRAQGGSVALPIWRDFMGAAMRGKQRTEWTRPPGVEVVRIDPRSGLRALPGQIDAIEEVFLSGTAPREEARPAGAPTPETLLLEETQVGAAAPAPSR